MKIHHIIYVFTGIFLIFFLWYSWNNQKAVSFNRTNIEYANMLTSACYDAAQTIDGEELGTRTGVWSSLDSRKRTLFVFYKSLAQNLNRDNDVKITSVPEFTPFVLLVDTNGFYLSYNACFDEYGNAIVPQNMDFVNVLGNLNTWTAEYEGNTIRYYLNDYVDVNTASGSFYSGLRNEVYEELNAEEKSALSFLTNDVAFEENRIYVVASTVEDIINYYLNTQSINVDGYTTGYQVTLPQLKHEDWSRMLQHPTVISFMQGKQRYVDGRMLNVYAYAAGELNTGYRYFVCDGLYYRADRVEGLIYETDEEGVVSVNYKGVPVTGFYNSVEECAKEGAIPSPDSY